MENPEVSSLPSEEPKPRKSPKLLKIIIAAIVALGAILGGVYYFTMYEAEDSPPSLTGGGSLQGFIKTGKYQFAGWGAGDEEKFIERKAELEEKGVEPALIKSGVNYLYANDDMTFLEIFEGIDLSDEKQIALTMYSPKEGKFLMWPENEFYTQGVKNVNPKDITVNAGQGFIAVISEDTEAWGVYLGDKNARKSTVCDSENIEKGWKLAAADEESLINVVKPCLEDVKTIFAQENNRFRKVYKREDEEALRDYKLENYIFWIKYDPVEEEVPKEEVPKEEVKPEEEKPEEEIKPEEKEPEKEEVKPEEEAKVEEDVKVILSTKTPKTTEVSQGEKDIPFISFTIQTSKPVAIKQISYLIEEMEGGSGSLYNNLIPQSIKLLDDEGSTIATNKINDVWGRFDFEKDELIVDGKEFFTITSDISVNATVKDKNYISIGDIGTYEKDIKIGGLPVKGNAMEIKEGEKDAGIVKVSLSSESQKGMLVNPGDKNVSFLTFNVTTQVPVDIESIMIGIEEMEGSSGNLEKNIDPNSVKLFGDKDDLIKDTSQIVADRFFYFTFKEGELSVDGSQDFTVKTNISDEAFGGDVNYFTLQELHVFGDAEIRGLTVEGNEMIISGGEYPDITESAHTMSQAGDIPIITNVVDVELSPTNPPTSFVAHGDVDHPYIYFRITTEQPMELEYVKFEIGETKDSSGALGDNFPSYGLEFNEGLTQLKKSPFVADDGYIFHFDEGEVKIDGMKDFNIKAEISNQAAIGDKNFFKITELDFYNKNFEVLGLPIQGNPMEIF